MSSETLLDEEDSEMSTLDVIFIVHHEGSVQYSDE